MAYLELGYLKEQQLKLIKMEQKKVFRSRISVLMTVFILLTLIPIFILAFSLFIRYESYKMLLVLGASLLFTIFVFSGFRYIISGNKLLIKMCSISYGSIDIANIVIVKRSYNLLSSPAASLKRLEISSESSVLCLISPVREEEFLEALKSINPQIRVNVSNKKGKWRIQDWDI